MDEGLSIRVDGVSKRYALSLSAAKSYGLRDIANDVLGRQPSTRSLRPDEFWALKDISFTVKPGECLVLLGPNGAGKTTMLKLLTGIFPPDEGRIEMRGRVGALIQLGAGFHPMMTGRENVYINGTILGLTRKEIEERYESILEFSGIGDFINSPVSYYSSGMTARLGFAVVAHLNPSILLIDEVLAVGDVGFRMKCFNHILGLIEQGVAIVLVTHSVNDALRISQRALVFAEGKRAFDGPIEEGIGIYQNFLDNDPNPPSEHEPISPKKEKKQAWLESVTPVDESGNPKSDFITGEDVNFDIRIGASESVTQGRIISHIVSKRLGYIGSVSTPFTDFEFTIEDPVTVIRLKYSKIPLLVEGYSLDITLCGPEIDDIYDRARPIAPFKIIGPTINAFGYGVSEIFKFEHSWEKISE